MTSHTLKFLEVHNDYSKPYKRKHLTQACLQYQKFRSLSLWKGTCRYAWHWRSSWVLHFNVLPKREIGPRVRFETLRPIPSDILSPKRSYLLVLLTPSEFHLLLTTTKDRWDYRVHFYSNHHTPHVLLASKFLTIL